MIYFENLVAIDVIAMTKKSMQAIVIKKEIRVDVSVTKIWQERKQEGRCCERKWEIEMRKKKDRHGWERGKLVQFEGNKPQSIQFHCFHNKF